MNSLWLWWCETNPHGLPILKDMNLSPKIHREPARVCSRAHGGFYDEIILHYGFNVPEQIRPALL
jgi:hypothetical protein